MFFFSPTGYTRKEIPERDPGETETGGAVPTFGAIRDLHQRGPGKALYSSPALSKNPSLRWSPRELECSTGFFFKIEFIAKNVLISDSSYLH